MKNIKDVMEGHEDGVILLTDVYHEKSDSDYNENECTKHKEVLQEINSALDFINSANKDASLRLDNIPKEVQSRAHKASSGADIAQSLQKLRNAKLKNADNIDKESLRESISPLELCIIDMLRPILIEWLDNNLPAIVEREVENAIAKIISINE